MFFTKKSQLGGVLPVFVPNPLRFCPQQAGSESPYFIFLSKRFTAPQIKKSAATHASAKTTAASQTPTLWANIEYDVSVRNENAVRISSPSPKKNVKNIGALIAAPLGDVYSNARSKCVISEYGKNTAASKINDVLTPVIAKESAIETSAHNVPPAQPVLRYAKQNASALMPKGET